MNPDKSSGDKSTRRRVKVYKLNDEGQWDDVGTGHVACVHHEVRRCSPPFHAKISVISFFLLRAHPFHLRSKLLFSNRLSLALKSPFRFLFLILCCARALLNQTFDALALTVKSEEKGGETILESKIQTEDIYQLQQGSCPTNLSCECQICSNLLPSIF